MKLVLKLLFCCVVMTAYADSKLIQTQSLPDMPTAMANNAVALLETEDGFEIYSFLGLEAGKTWQDTSSEVMRYSAGENPLAGTWKIIGPVPGDHGRLAASAVTVRNEIYLFGGYTVASDHSEQSTLEVFKYKQQSDGFEVFTTMPVPVEDSVLGVYQDRWIYLISGWHDLGNVNLVQILDVETATWTQATPFPGAPVFGHAGGIVGNTIVVCDGVKIRYQAEPEPRQFLPSNECWKGTISPDNHRRIDWRQIEAHPGQPLYRMAAGSDGVSSIWFAGGSNNPYNFNGVGYNGIPSGPEKGVFRYDVDVKKWIVEGNLDVATMDHRGLLHFDGWFYIVGGMRAGQEVSAGAFKFKP